MSWEATEDVQNGTDRQEDQGRPAVAHGSQDGGEHVIQDRGRKARVDDHQVDPGMGIHIASGVQRSQQGPRKTDENSRQDDRLQQGNDIMGRDAPLYALFVTRAETLGGQDGTAGGIAYGKTHGKKHKRARDADGCELDDAERPADDHGVEKAV